MIKSLKTYRLLLFIAGLFLCAWKVETAQKSNSLHQTVPQNPFENIDKHARNSPKAVEKDIPSLAKYLREAAQTDLEKARAIFVWITYNISYDDNAYNDNKPSNSKAADVLKGKKSVCEGFSNLYLALGLEMGLEIKKVSGYAKGYSYMPGRKFRDTNHAWNVIKIDGTWRVFDATWGEGSGKNKKGEMQSKKIFDEYWFNVEPYEAIFNHLPKDKEYAFVEPALDLSAYEAFPNLDEEYFSLGFNGMETYKNAYENRSITFPKCYNIQTPVKAISAPGNGILYTNQEYEFEFYIPEGTGMCMIDSKNKWTYFNGSKERFTLKYTPSKRGNLEVCVRHGKNQKTYVTVMRYMVKDKVTD